MDKVLLVDKVHTIVHTDGMKTKRITISVPDYFYDELRLQVSPGNVSSFFVEAVEEKLLDKRIAKKTDPVEEFIALRKTAPKLNDKQIFAAIKRGRM